MIQYPYLISLALIQQKGERAMPLGGRSIKGLISKDENPGKIGEDLAKELLLRIYQNSDKAPLQRAAAEQSLLLIQIEMELMQNNIPTLKSQWIRSGDT